VPHIARPSPRPSAFHLLGIAVLSAVVLFAAAAVSAPGDALGATVTKAAVCGANLRTSPYTTARLRTSIKTGTKVTVVTGVTGGSWRAVCAGKTVSGKSWYRISAVNGKSLKSLYGVTYLYAASGLFKALAPSGVMRYAACSLYLRSSTSTSATARSLIKTDARVTVVATVTGGSWNTTCAGSAVSGASWYRITGVNGTSVKSLFGVSYVYGATGLFKNAVTATPSPTPTPATAAAPTPTPSPARSQITEGIDVSHWQGPIDWTRVAAAGKRFTYLKASEDTTYEDPTYPTNRAAARAAGLYVGAYHFAQPSAIVGAATAQADHFIDTAMPAPGDLLPVLDLERSGGIGQAALTAWVREYLERVYQRIGVRTVIYCSPSFWRNYMGDTTWFAANHYEILWIAHWTAGVSPTVPGGNWGGRGWTFWQYTSDGSVPGISGRVDLDRYNGTDFTRVLIRDQTTSLTPQSSEPGAGPVAPWPG
jgi:GH25 family lysozyme M1 (1,4-beta-N-acetylmuramidase)